MRKTVILLFAVIIIVALIIVGINYNRKGADKLDVTSTQQTTQKIKYIKISQDEAKEIIDSEEKAVILDVRTPEEYQQGHIKNAVLVPDYELIDTIEDKFPNKDELILVYCRSGRRSATAAELLISMGYTNVKDFGGIIDWKYETVSE